MWEVKGDTYSKRVNLKSGDIRLVKVRIRKQSKIRRIFVPDDESKSFYRGLMGYLDKIHLKAKLVDSAHGFISGKSAISNAEAHIGYDVTISMDLLNFFESITPRHVERYLPSKLIDVCFVEGILPQGVPTSPVISNIACVELDKSITDLLAKYQASKIITKFSFTRYADDISVSFKFAEPCEIDSAICPFSDANRISSKYMKVFCSNIIRDVEKILKSYDFYLNNKTKFQIASNGRRVITRVSVGEFDIKATRRIKKKLRAAIHKSNVNSVLGLVNWISQQG